MRLLLVALLLCTAASQLSPCTTCSSVVQGFKDLRGELLSESLGLDQVITRYCISRRHSDVYATIWCLCKVMSQSFCKQVSQSIYFLRSPALR
jgi:hypothetical protein